MSRNPRWPEAGLEQLLRLLPPGVSRSVLRAAARAYSRIGEEWASLLFRPDRSDRIARPGDLPPPDGRAYGLLLQGPLFLDRDFTLETLRIYKKNQDVRAMILSTWEEESSDQIGRIRDLGVEVIQSPPPASPGMWNLNLQIASTMAGLRRADALGCTHVLKARTDQRMYRPNALSALGALLDAFPCPKGSGHHQRIAVASLNSYVYRPYSLSDMFVFGDLSDMLRYWDLPLDGASRGSSDYDGISMSKLLEIRCPEIAIMDHFLSSLGHSLQGTLEDYHDIVQRHFLVVDQEMMDLVWAKQRRQSKEFPDRNYGAHSALENWTFSRWLSMQAFRPWGARVACDLQRTTLTGRIVP